MAGGQNVKLLFQHPDIPDNCTFTSSAGYIYSDTAKADEDNLGSLRVETKVIKGSEHDSANYLKIQDEGVPGDVTFTFEDVSLSRSYGRKGRLTLDGNSGSYITIYNTATRTHIGHWSRPVGVDTDGDGIADTIFCLFSDRNAGVYRLYSASGGVSGSMGTWSEVNTITPSGSVDNTNNSYSCALVYLPRKKALVMMMIDGTNSRYFSRVSYDLGVTIEAGENVVRSYGTAPTTVGIDAIVLRDKYIAAVMVYDNGTGEDEVRMKLSSDGINWKWGSDPMNTQANDEWRHPTVVQRDDNTVSVAAQCTTGTTTAGYYMRDITWQDRTWTNATETMPPITGRFDISIIRGLNGNLYAYNNGGTYIQSSIATYGGSGFGAWSNTSTTAANATAVQGNLINGEMMFIGAANTGNYDIRFFASFYERYFSSPDNSWTNRFHSDWQIMRGSAYRFLGGEGTKNDAYFVETSNLYPPETVFNGTPSIGWRCPLNLVADPAKYISVDSDFSGTNRFPVSHAAIFGCSNNRIGIDVLHTGTKYELTHHDGITGTVGAMSANTMVITSAALTLSHGMEHNYIATGVNQYAKIQDFIITSDGTKRFIFDGTFDVATYFSGATAFTLITDHKYIVLDSTLTSSEVRLAVAHEVGAEYEEAAVNYDHMFINSAVLGIELEIDSLPTIQTTIGNTTSSPLKTFASGRVDSKKLGKPMRMYTLSFTNLSDIMINKILNAFKVNEYSRKPFAFVDTYGAAHCVRLASNDLTASKGPNGTNNITLQLVEQV